jgi:anti-anti-sigma regulatory factor
MIVDMETHELSPGITAISFTGRLVLGNRLTDVERAIRETIKQGSRKLVLDFSRLSFINSAGR